MMVAHMMAFSLFRVIFINIVKAKFYYIVECASKKCASLKEFNCLNTNDVRLRTTISIQYRGLC